MTEQFSEIKPAEHSRGAGLQSLIVAILAFLLPVFLIPAADFPVQFTKAFFAVGAVVLLLVLFAFSVIRTRSISFSFSLPLLSFVLLPIAYLLSAMFASTPALSLWGNQMETDTFGFMLLSSALAVSVFLSVRSARQIFSVLLGFLAGGAAVILFQLIQLVFGGPLPSLIFSSPVINLIGSWNGLGIFLGLLASLSLVALEALSLSRMHQWLLRGLLFVAIALLVIVNFNLAWILTGIVAFAVFVHTLIRSFTGESGGRGTGVTAAVVLLVSVFFVFAGASTSVWVQNSFGIQTLDVRPSIEGTLSVAESVYGKSPVFGSGPNTFSAEWLLSRPQAVISTPFWDVAFPSGFGFIPSSSATGGVVVLVAWLLIIGTFVAALWKALITPLRDPRSFFFIAVSAAGSLYLLVMHMFYVPDSVLTLVMFLFFGLFLASLREAGLISEKVVLFKENPRIGFVSVLLVLVLAIGALFGLYGGASLYASTLYHQSALTRSNAGDLDGARSAMVSAINLSEQDRHYRALSAIELGRLNSVVNSTELSDTEKQTQFRDILGSAINASIRATELNPGNYANWIARAAVFSSVVPLKIEGAYENAVDVLTQARTRNPYTPEIDFRLAQLKAVTGDRAGARTSAADALLKKADYTPAILLLAELSLAEGKLDDAITSVESVVFLEPQNSQLLYQLGLLRLQARDYAEARDAFVAALRVNPDYANASFFLGQAQYLAGAKDEALQTLMTLRTKHQDNETLREVVEMIQRGENPFTSVPSSQNVQTPTQ